MALVGTMSPIFMVLPNADAARVIGALAELWPRTFVIDHELQNEHGPDVCLSGPSRKCFDLTETASQARVTHHRARKKRDELPS
jgi:hypothetical protein